MPESVEPLRLECIRSLSN